MGELLLFIVVALTVAAIVFGVTVMVSGGDPGLTPVEPDGLAVPLPGDRPLGEEDVVHARFDVAFRGYRMAQVDQALQRAAYDIGYKGELISVLEAEVIALREGRTADADVLRRAREAAAQPVVDVPDDPANDPAAGPVAAGPVAAGPVAAGPVAGSALPPPPDDPGGSAAEVSPAVTAAPPGPPAVPASSVPASSVPPPAGAQAPPTPVNQPVMKSRAGDGERAQRR